MWIVLGSILFILLLFWLLLRRRRLKDAASLRIAFVHPDLGIGGAERLIVDAAVALQKAGHKISIYTAHHSHGHCFKETRDGTLSVVVYGDFLPTRILGRFYAACAYLRMCWVSLRIVLLSFLDAFDVIIVDQVSICLPILWLARPCGIIFYCHYPDYLLTQRTSLLKRLYRMPLDFLEEMTTGLATTIFVNSKFTAGVFKEAFPTLSSFGTNPAVLYPALNLEDQDRVAESARAKSDVLEDGEQLLLSINRFERKKNIDLAIQAFAQLPEKIRKCTKLVLAGGYDTNLPENVEHAAELAKKAEELGVGDRVLQRWNISAEDKAAFLRHATCLMYTPDREHFGIVPVEAMYARLPVLAVNSGGPLESVVDGETGYLRHSDPQVWADAAQKLLQDQSLKTRMGEAGRERVRAQFSLEAFGRTLNNAATSLALGNVGAKDE